MDFSGDFRLISKSIALIYLLYGIKSPDHLNCYEMSPIAKKGSNDISINISFIWQYRPQKSPNGNLPWSRMELLLYICNWTI